MRFNPQAEKVLSDRYWGDEARGYLRQLYAGENPRIPTEFRSAFRFDWKLVEGDEWNLKLTELGKEIARKLFW